MLNMSIYINWMAGCKGCARKMGMKSDRPDAIGIAPALGLGDVFLIEAQGLTHLGHRIAPTWAGPHLVAGWETYATVGQVFQPAREIVRAERMCNSVMSHPEREPPAKNFASCVRLICNEFERRI